MFFALKSISTNSLGPSSVVMKQFSCSPKLSMQFIMLINVKMPQIELLPDLTGSYGS